MQYAFSSTCNSTKLPQPIFNKQQITRKQSFKYEQKTARFALTYRPLAIFWESTETLQVNRSGGSVFEVLQYLIQQFPGNFQLAMTKLCKTNILCSDNQLFIELESIFG
ncbi:Hypothetical_protein [Hexamita inflata]|uniref:Hypothetical_protein n=1 Tax=Hexamita inflata TaxID=28002 RepID=A0ABP1GJC7_9EUKA